MPYREPVGRDDEGSVLFIEYDVTARWRSVVGLMNAMEEDGADTDGTDWMAWRTG